MSSKSSVNKGSIFLVLIFMILAITAVVMIFALQTDTVGDMLKNDELVKILIVLKKEGTPICTDVLIYYPVSRRGALFDIPGNTGAIFSSIGRTDRIDQVYVEKGIDVYKSEIQKLTGTSIPFTLEIDLEDFSVLTDLLGGLRVFVPTAVDYISTDNQRILLPSGAVTLDGDKIADYLTYALPEDTNSDIQDRKQNAVVAFFSALNTNKSTVFNKKVFPFFGQHIQSNVDEEGLYKLLSEISAIDAERLMPQTVLGASRIVEGKTLLFPYYDGQLIKDVFKQTTTALVSASGQVASRVYVLEIQNGTTVQGLAKNTAAILQGAGYDVLSTINAESNDIDSTMIIDYIGNEAEAKVLADFILCENIVTEEVKTDDELEADSLVDFTIILGKDFDGRYVR
ncbi:MAG: LCP family protein [Spirochaetaceae bacterium]|nr:LCP family protein [Spirochaetaceae bacterium]